MDKEFRKKMDIADNETPPDPDKVQTGDKWYGYTEVILQEYLIIEEYFRWLFFYNSKKFVETGDLMHSLLGPGPIIVLKHDGTVFETGSAYFSKYYIENMKKFGNPYGDR